MCLFNFVLFFRINYKCKLGESVYLVGNTKTLGNWDPSRAIRLSWKEGHNWEANIKLTHDNTQILEYKFFIAPTHDPCSCCVVRWEQGSNRFIDLLSANSLYIREECIWDMQKVGIELYSKAFEQLKNPNNKVLIHLQQGNEPVTKSLQLKSIFVQPGNKEELFWTTTLIIPSTMTQFSYRYQIVNPNTKETINDKHRRKIFLDRFPQTAQVTSERYTMRGPKKIKLDFVFDGDLSYDQITPQIYVGSFPQTCKDIDQLKSLGITGVLNLQSHEDFLKYGLQWKNLKKYYTDNDIHAEHFSMSDMDIEDMINKTSKAAEVLDLLLMQHSKVYVHCTAGKNRSPQAVMYYLWKHKKLDLEKAMNTVKSKRVKANVFNDVFLRTQ